MSIACQDKAHTEYEIQLIWFPWKHCIDANSVTEPFEQAELLVIPGSTQCRSIQSNGQHSRLGEARASAMIQIY